MFGPILLILSFSAVASFEGTVKLSNCSGALVRVPGMSDDQAAWIMTNGHCLESDRYLRSDEVIHNRREYRRVELLSSTKKKVGLATSRLLYATVKDTDLAFYELKSTYAEIKSRYGISPLELQATAPVAGTLIEIPSGFWSKSWSCTLEAIVPTLKENDFTWKNSLRYSPECKTLINSSGSPILIQGTRTVIGVNNTASTRGQKCTLHNPCEVSDTGEIRAVKGTAYGQAAWMVTTCLDEAFEIDLGLPGCQLPK